MYKIFKNKLSHTDNEEVDVMITEDGTYIRTTDGEIINPGKGFVILGNETVLEVAKWIVDNMREE